MKKGFTLLELLVVIGIIGILVAIGTVSYSSAQQRSRDAKRRADVEAVSKALEQYYADNSSSYPVSGDCTGYDSYLAAGVPTDPKTGSVYPAGDSCSSTAFCVCVQLEGTGDVGNAYGKSGQSCTWTGAGTKSYFCAQNQQ